MDPDASFDATFRAHYWPMVRALTVACGDQEVAADAVQDGFTARTRAGAASRATTTRRAGSATSPSTASATTTARSSAAGEPSTASARAPRPRWRVPSRAVDVGALLATLSPQQRTAAALFYVEQCSVREIADAMKLSEGAVKYHLHAARTALRGTAKGTVDAP